MGKSTLTNTLAGTDSIATQAIHEDDANGHHTTTGRALYRIPGGCLVLDTPGMRELQMTDAASGIAETFEDIEALAAHCRFDDCQHEAEPGCAVRESIDGGSLDPARLRRWRKLIAEDRFNSASLAQRRSQQRAFGKMVKKTMKERQVRRRF